MSLTWSLAEKLSDSDRHEQKLPKFLNELEKKNFDSDPIELFGQSDLQLVETSMS